MGATSAVWLIRELWLPILAAALILIAACGGGNDGGEPSLISEGAVAPDFTLPAANGQPITLSDVITEDSVLLYFSMGSG